MPDELFWGLTWDEVLLFLEEVRRREERIDLLFGLVAAQVENFSSAGRPGRAKQPRDFFRRGALVTEEVLQKFRERPLMRTGPRLVA